MIFCGHLWRRILPGIQLDLPSPQTTFHLTEPSSSLSTVSIETSSSCEASG